jgi:tripartite-type tricarboxylate transporter receptor subunit TctC
MAAAGAQPAPGGASAYPAKPVKFVNAYPPGGSSDVIARLVAQKLSEQLGQPVIVENRTGAAGVIGNDFVAKQAPDGYTLLLITGAYPVQAAMLKTLPFDPLRDIAMVSMLTTYPFVLNVLPGAPWGTLGEFIAYARANPGKLNYASSGVGSIHHFSAELFNAMAGTDIRHVPFRGGAGPMTELLAGRVDALFEAMTLSLPYVKSGRTRALAVTSGDRSRALPDVPAIGETLPGYEVTSFLGVATTGGTPVPIIERLNREARRMIDSPDMFKRLVELGGEPAASSAAEMRDLVAREIGKWRRVIELRGIAAD